LHNHELVKRDLEIIKNHDNLKNVLKIGITSETDSNQAYSKEFHSILIKPIHLPKLVEVVGSYFNVIGSIGKSEAKKDAKPEIIDKELLNEVIDLLQNKHYKLWESSLMTSSFSEIEEFAQNMKNIGMQYNLKPLQAFSDVLVMHVKNFDIDSMNDVLKSYPSIISELKNSL
jgi:hypothetical protein